MTEPLKPTPEPAYPSAVPPVYPSAVTPAGGPAPRRVRPVLDRGRLLFGSGGLVLGILIGVLLAGLVHADTTPSASNAIASAVEACAAGEASGIEVLDGGNSIQMKTAGKDVGQPGAHYKKVACILNELHAPESLISKMDATRALDGTLQGHWDNLSASWTYHPDNGLRVIVETVRE